VILFLSLALGCYEPVESVKPLHMNRPKAKAEAVVAPPAPIVATFQGPPRIHRVHVEPRAPTASQDLRVIVDVSDPDDDPIDLDYLWIINDVELLHQKASSLPSSAFVKGDEVRVRVTAQDATHTAHRVSAGLTIKNSPPLFVRDPRMLGSINGSRIEATDPDDDPVSYRLVGAPEGMSIDPTSGRISYTGSKDEPGGNYKARVVAEDPDKASVIFAFDLTVSAGSGAARPAAKIEGDQQPESSQTAE
jgi:hypothetical protein